MDPIVVSDYVIFLGLAAVLLGCFALAAHSEGR